MENQALSGEILAIIIFTALAILILLVSSERKKYTDKNTEAHGTTGPCEKSDVRDRSETETNKNYIPAKVHYVIDGDTVVVSKSWQRIKIRLDSIDCPEDGQHWGDIARFALIKMIGGRTVFLEEHGQDHFGRTLATIYVRNMHDPGLMNVNARMVTLGHAWVMRKYYDHLPEGRQIELNKLERWAKSKKVGLWKTSNPIPPWIWRGNNKSA